MRIRDEIRIIIKLTEDGDSNVTSRSTDSSEFSDIARVLAFCLIDSGLTRVLEIFAMAIVNYNRREGVLEQGECEFVEAAEKHMDWWRKKDKKVDSECQDSSIAWFAALQRASKEDDYDLVAEAHRQLNRLGIKISFGKEESKVKM